MQRGHSTWLAKVAGLNTSKRLNSALYPCAALWRINYTEILITRAVLKPFFDLKSLKKCAVLLMFCAIKMENKLRSKEMLHKLYIIYIFDPHLEI